MARTALIALLLLIPVAAGHGAPAVREIEDRMLADTDAQRDYGSEEGGVPPLLYEGGHDLLALDLREGNNESGHILVFRLIMQAGDPAQGQLKEEIRFTANGTEHLVTITSADNEAFSVDGASGEGIEIGDEHVRGVEFWFPAAELGVASGDTLSGVRVQGYVGDSTADVMPGTYDFAGQRVPADEEFPESIDWALGGPFETFTMRVEDGWSGRNGTGSVIVKSTLSALSQFVMLDASVYGNATLTEAQQQVLLGPAAERRITFSFQDALAGDSFLVTATSDLDAILEERIPIDAPAPKNTTQPPTPEPEQDSPMPLPLVIAALAVAWTGRRR